MDLKGKVCQSRNYLLAFERNELWRSRGCQYLSVKIFHYSHYIHCIHYFHSNLFNATFRHVSSICARSAKGGDLTTTDQTSAIDVKLPAVMKPLM